MGVGFGQASSRRRVYDRFTYRCRNHASTQWDRQAARDIFIFGTGIFLSTATYFLGGEAERLVIGKFISLAELGCFSLALTIAAAPSRAIQQVVGQVFFPLMADSVRNDRATATRHFRSARYVFLILSIGVGMGFIAYSHRIVSVLLPPKYSDTGWMLQLLGFRAALDVFVAPVSNLILACGDSRYAAAANTLRLVLMVGGVWFAFTKFGLHSAIGVLAYVPVIAYLVLWPGVKHHLNGALWLEIGSFCAFMACMAFAAFTPWPWA